MATANIPGQAVGCPRARHRRRSHRGAILVAALMCVFIIGAVTVTATRSMVRQARQARQQAHQQQAYWIAVSALDRAAAMRRQQPDYRGETWTIPAAELDGRRQGVAEIRLSKQGASQLIVNVRAAYPADDIHRITIEKQGVVAE